MKKKSKGQKAGGEMLLCLCAACVKQFYDSPEHKVRRMNPDQESKEACSYCSVRRGFDYIVTRKET
jgi:hypothetical protein